MVCCSIENNSMEKRIFGVILIVLGIAGLIIAAYNFLQKGDQTTYDVKSIAVYALLGLLFFFGGVGLLRSTKDKAI
jgi:uncharacterized membrane protein